MDYHNDNEQQEDCKKREDGDDDENDELAAFLCWQTVINQQKLYLNYSRVATKLNPR